MKDGQQKPEVTPPATLEERILRVQPGQLTQEELDALTKSGFLDEDDD